MYSVLVLFRDLLMTYMFYVRRTSDADLLPTCRLATLPAVCLPQSLSAWITDEYMYIPSPQLESRGSACTRVM